MPRGVQGVVPRGDWFGAVAAIRLQCPERRNATALKLALLGSLIARGGRSYNSDSWGRCCSARIGASAQRCPNLRTRYLLQPFGPNGELVTLGHALTTEIGSPVYNELEMAVAFATSSGTSRIYGAVRALRARGATATAHVGLSNGITSAQAVEQLIQAGVSVFGFETGGSVLFHPKAYILRSPGHTWISVGSSNLTADGLYRNFEANSISIGGGTPDDAAAIAELSQVLRNLRGMQGHSSRLELGDLQRLVTAGSLIDETVTPVPQRIGVGRGTPRQRGAAQRIQVPAAPPPHPDLGTVRRPRPAAAPAAAAPIAPAIQSRFFAMTLSDFDVSHRRGVPGTPEVSLPEECVAFFPAVQMQGRQYPDAYFEVLLNERTGGARPARYRIWQRPPGTDAGHADWRINVGHDTIDQTGAGGDILLVERLPDGSDPAYEVWIVRAADPEHAPLLTRCNRSVQARGRAGVKQFGLF